MYNNNVRATETFLYPTQNINVNVNVTSRPAGAQGVYFHSHYTPTPQKPAKPVTRTTTNTNTNTELSKYQIIPLHISPRAHHQPTGYPQVRDRFGSIRFDSIRFGSVRALADTPQRIKCVFSSVCFSHFKKNRERTKTQRATNGVWFFLPYTYQPKHVQEKRKTKTTHQSKAPSLIDESHDLVTSLLRLARSRRPQPP